MRKKKSRHPKLTSAELREWRKEHETLLRSCELKDGCSDPSTPGETLAGWVKALDEWHPRWCERLWKKRMRALLHNPNLPSYILKAYWREGRMMRSRGEWVPDNGEHFATHVLSSPGWMMCVLESPELSLAPQRVEAQMTRSTARLAVLARADDARTADLAVQNRRCAPATTARTMASFPWERVVRNVEARTDIPTPAVDVVVDRAFEMADFPLCLPTEIVHIVCSCGEAMVRRLIAWCEGKAADFGLNLYSVIVQPELPATDPCLAWMYHMMTSLMQNEFMPPEVATGLVRYVIVNDAFRHPGVSSIPYDSLPAPLANILFFNTSHATHAPRHLTAFLTKHVPFAFADRWNRNTYAKARHRVMVGGRIRAKNKKSKSITKPIKRPPLRKRGKGKPRAPFGYFLWTNRVDATVEITDFHLVRADRCTSLQSGYHHVDRDKFPWVSRFAKRATAAPR